MTRAPVILPPVIEHHYDALPQQREAARLGMWVFLASEVMFFGALITSYAAFRYSYPAVFQTSGLEMSKLIGTINTAILLTSSFTAALAVHATQDGRARAATTMLWTTAALGVAFDTLKLHEYAEHLRQGKGPSFDLFYTLYYILTGVHAVHVGIGVAVLATLAVMARRTGIRSTVVENGALYWHFVDIVWIFLYPLFYLVGGSK